MNGKRMLLAAFILSCHPLGYAEEIRSSLNDQLGLAVTIYNDNLALVKDKRKITLPKGMSDLAFREVSARIRPETALLRSLDKNSSLSVLEQNFDFDLLTPASLLKKYVGKQVRVVRTHPSTGEETTEKATVLATNNGVVLKIGNRIETQVPGRLVFDDVPDNLRDKPTLVMRLNNAKAGPRNVELSYLTGGLSWRADYVAELSADDKFLTLNGWVTLTNKSGTSYPDAILQLVAGDVNQVQPVRQEKAYRGRVMMADAAAPMMAEESLFEYHLYTVGHPTTIGNQQTKQVSLLSAANIPANKEYVLQGQDYYYRNANAALGEKLKVGVFLEFKNSQKNNLGIPLPKGIMRLYKRDSQERAQFVGEDRIDHTPKNELVRLKLGNAFDITANKTQTDFKKHSGFSRYNYDFESAYKIELKNAKEEAVLVNVREPVPGDWQVIKESHPHTKGSARVAQWRISVPANGQTVLTYRVRSRY